MSDAGSIRFGQVFVPSRVTLTNPIINGGTMNGVSGFGIGSMLEILTGLGLDAGTVTVTGTIISDSGAPITVNLTLVTTGTDATIRSGPGVPTDVQPNASIWQRTDGGMDARLYVSDGAGTWSAVAGV